MLISCSGAWLQVPEKGARGGHFCLQDPSPSLPYRRQDPGRCTGQQGQSTGQRGTKASHTFLVTSEITLTMLLGYKGLHEAYPASNQGGVSVCRFSDDRPLDEGPRAKRDWSKTSSGPVSFQGVPALFLT